MKVIFLGYGIAGLIFDTVISNMVPEADVTFITMQKLPNADFGLRYIHPPHNLPNKVTPYASLYSFIQESCGEFAASETIQMEFAIRTKLGYLPRHNTLGLEQRLNLVGDYCINNFRQYEKFAMNSFTESPEPRRLAAPYTGVIANMEKHAKSEVHTGFITDIDLVNKVIKYNTKLEPHEVECDLIINSIPLPIFTEMIDPDALDNGTQFRYIPSLCVKSNSFVDTRLNYMYNTAPTDDKEEINLSRVTFKRQRTDFEFSVAGTLETTAAIKAKFPVVKNIMMEILKELNSLYFVDWSETNFLAPNIIPNAHFYESPETEQAVIDIESTGTIMMGRYAQWNHSIKMAEMWDKAVLICEGIMYDGKR